MPVLPVPVPVPSGDDGHIEAAAPAEEATDETEDDAELIPVIVGADGVEEETEETVEMVEMTEPVEAEFVETTEPDDEVEFIVGPLPRLPFFGCEEVTEDDFRAILEEIARNPES